MLSARKTKPKRFTLGSEFGEVRAHSKAGCCASRTAIAARGADRGLAVHEIGVGHAVGPDDRCEGGEADGDECFLHGVFSGGCFKGFKRFSTLQPCDRSMRWCRCHGPIRLTELSTRQNEHAALHTCQH